MESSLNGMRGLADEKRRIRKEILSVRNMLSPRLRQEKSGKILQTIIEMEAYKVTDVMLCYADYQSEVMTVPLIERALGDGKKVFCPKVLGSDMEFYRITEIGSLKEGYKGIKEPSGGQGFLDFSHDNKTLVIMPGVAFDRDCHRLGYGKGFYDRYLAGLSERGIGVCKLGLGYECQLIDEAPYEAHDVVLDMLVTEENIYRRSE